MKSFIYLLYFVITSVLCEKNLMNGRTSDISKFPDLFKMENYYECPDDSSFCTASLKLLPSNTDCKFWKSLEDWSKASLFHFNRTLIYRTVCIPANCTSDNQKKDFIENTINQEVEVYNFSSELVTLNCMEPKEYNNDLRYIMIGISLYVVLLLVATTYSETLYDRNCHSKLEEILVCFSLTNFKNITALKSKDFQKLRCIQGVRTILSVCVVGGHTCMMISVKNIRNPEFFETMMGTTLMKYLLLASYSIMALFFCLSTWFLTLQILTKHHRSKQFTIRDAGLMILHRIVRMWPILAVNFFVVLPIYMRFGYGPGTFEVGKLINDACEKNWWVTFLFATNFLPSYDTCHLGMWYLSIDSQLYLMTIVFLYFILKYKLNLKKCVYVLLIASYIIVAILIYVKELGPDTMITVKLATNMNIFKNEKTPYTLYGFWVNFSSSILGILFGYFYFQNTQIEDKPEPYEKHYWKILLICPLLSLVLADINHNRVLTAIFGAMFRIVFTFGLATGIYGMSRNVIKGFFRSILEHKYLVHLGKFTFCTYVFHFWWVFHRGAHYSQPIELYHSKIVLWTVIDIITSFIIGIILTFTIELPCIFIQKQILPPIWTKTAEDYVQEKSK
ncbi:unnamed protein product [Ceutorhynchus assimilis]|uniref:Acyltransferase 3 domain-containing protein n=1 Tax=Ceutorhynchus assimilis TaxID=467358 RepID=A0A9N9QHF9_9CUCU|nr:unnamed protein product [Ceutorhynchus assimilis]